MWIEGSAGARLTARSSGPATLATAAGVDGGLTLPRRYDTVLVGPSADDPSSPGSLAAGRAAICDRLLRGRPGGPRRERRSLDAAAAQIAVLRDHVRFLQAARDEDNLANVRFHGEHMVNITRGEPLRDVDGNGDVSNPGDGVGLIDGPDAYLRRIGALVGPALTDRTARPPSRPASSPAAGSWPGRPPPCPRPSRRSRRSRAPTPALDVAWAALRDDAAGAATIALEPR